MTKPKAPKGAQPQDQATPVPQDQDQNAGGLNPPEVPDPADFENDDDEVNDQPEPPIDITPAKLKGKPGVAILLEACAVFGVNPDPDCKPRELLDYRYYPDVDGDEAENAVVIVTAGGVKLRYPIDQDTETTLQRVLGLVTTQKQPDGSVVEVRKPIPDNLTLPALSVTGVVPKDGAHVYPSGYLRRGEGKVPAARKAGK